jgi:ribonuclease P protein subunit RPR2
VKGKRQIAKERMKILVDKAVKDKKKRYVELARKVGMKARQPMPKDLKFKYCKKCKEPYSSDTLKVRVNSKKNTVIYECLKCGDKRRYPFVREKKA